MDCYRNPKGDVSLIANYNQPLYLAVKARNKVFETNSKTLADIFIVNEFDVKGEFDLEVSVSDEKKEFFKKTYPVSVTGGNVYGELLVKGIEITPDREGYCIIRAKLFRDKELITEGSDQLFTVMTDVKSVQPGFTLMDSSDILAKYFSAAGIMNPGIYSGGRPKTSCLIVGAALPPENYPIRHELYEWVAEGNTIIVAGSADKWAPSLGRREIIDFRGVKPLGSLWNGGNYFVKEHPVFEGLPQNCVFNWEYQCFVQYKRNRYGLRLGGDDVIVGASSDHRQELYSVVSIIPVGKGKIILSALDILGAIKEGNPSSVVAKKLLLNYISYAQRLNR
ncbi:MAG: hypothetical protein HC905_19645 [Bacteroidales bacterium]|nr:hypothetical protein [Bacteroidales bacterium]